MRMVDIAALLRVLPVSDLEPDHLAWIRGFSEKLPDEWKEPHLVFLEPPAGQHVPFIDPVEALALLLRYQGQEHDAALIEAKAAFAEFRPRLHVPECVTTYRCVDYDGPECISFTRFMELLLEKDQVSTDIVEFLERAAAVVAASPMFEGPDNWGSPWKLSDLPDLPPEKAMFEFIPGPPWDMGTYEDRLFDVWRDSLRPIAERLEKALGEPVYYFATPGDEHDDDAGHRFLWLHWCCTARPDSAFIRFLVGVSGAGDVEELKQALIDPASYVHPFKMNDAFRGLESSSCRLEYIPPKAKKTVAMVISAPEALSWAQFLLLQQIGADVLVVAPKEMLSEEWVMTATHYCRTREMMYLHDYLPVKPITLLASLDALIVISEERSAKQVWSLGLSASVEDLLWRAKALSIPTTFFYVDGSGLGNPETCLEHRQVPERVAAQDKQREAYTSRLEEIRFACDYSSSGLWNAKGEMLGYDLLSIPFSLIRRVAAWQRDYDETMDPPAFMGDDAWWEKHFHEEAEIARDMQDALGAAPRVIVAREGGWKWIGDIPIEIGA